VALAIYVDAPERPYYFWRGINPAAMIALAAGCFTYIAFLNPLSYDSIAPYPYLTASLPSATAAALAYFLVSLLVIRAGLGGYPRK
jgi:NCS1 family nucleobase:cation symporter-1